MEVADLDDGHVAPADDPCWVTTYGADAFDYSAIYMAVFQLLPPE